MSKAEYVYAVDGTKLAVWEGSGTDGYDYKGSFICKANGELESVAIADRLIINICIWT